MNSRNDKEIASARQDEREGGREEPIRNGYAIYNAPVYNIREAINSNFGLNNGYISQVNGHGTVAGGPAHMVAGADLFSLLNPILDASHTRDMELSPPNSQCLPGTRMGVIGDIRAWADSGDIEANPHIMWVFGCAGCGKSAIAHKMANILADEDRLAACFVFFRGSGDRSTSTRFATTIASQVASAIPETESIIESTVRRNRALLSNASTSLSNQFKHLVYLPIRAIRPKVRQPFIIILDGADECRGRKLSIFIKDMIAFFDQYPDTPLRFLITSRVEDHLHQALHSSRQVKLLNLAERPTRGDIVAALDVAIANAKRGRRFARDEDWPNSEERWQLVHHVGGNFLFMSLIIDRISDPQLKDGRTPKERLALALSQNTDLDDLYSQILTPCQNLAYFHAVISTIALAFQPLSVVQLAEILNIKTVNVLDVLIDLQSIIQVPGDDHAPVTLYHTSLRDFLCAEDRSGSFYAEPQYHRQLAYRALRVQSPLGPASSWYICHFAMDHMEKYLEGLDEPEQIKVAAPFKEHIFNNGQTVLEIASLKQKWMVVRALVNAGVDVDVRFKKSRVSVLCALHTACYHGHVEMICFLLKRGANPNIVSPNTNSGGFNDGTPLVFAARKGDVKLATRLLECGADPNLQGGNWGTALRAACVEGSLEIVELLLEHGADPNLRERHRSPLHSCAYYRHQDCARALLMRNADPNPQNNHGDTPLHDACRRGYDKVVECLLEFKADASIKNKKGQTALQVSQDEGRHNVVELLRRHGIRE